MTNAEKFREVFGFTPRKKTTTKEIACLAPQKVCDEFEECIGCPFLGWWNREYKAESEDKE